MIHFVKDPDARLDYAVDWSDFLTSVDDTLLTATFVDIDSDLVISGESIVDGSLHQAFIAGGSVGKMYRVTSRLTTVGGREDDQSFMIYVREQ